MKWFHSIRFKLLSLYIVLLTVVFLVFGLFVYWNFRAYMIDYMKRNLARRANQIGISLVKNIDETGSEYIVREIQARYAPELNDRFILIRKKDGSDIYTSRNTINVPRELIHNLISNTLSSLQTYQETKLTSEKKSLFVTQRCSSQSGEDYFIIVGTSEEDIASALQNLIRNLGIGFPLLLGLSIIAGYLLLGKALHPVDEVLKAAEFITLKNLGKRLPVPNTGDEFERLALGLNRMIKRLDEAFQLNNRFTEDASHELRTPLTIIQGELEVFINDPSQSRQSVERVGDILEEVVRLSRIVDGLLLVSRLEAGEAHMKIVKVDLGKMVASVAEQMELLSKDKLLTLKYDISDHVIVEGDELRLQQIVVNLIDNAIKYTPEGGTVSLKVEMNEDRAIIEVADTGMGISATALPQVFNRFFRAEEARSGRIQGTGLGLSIVQSITEAHRGYVHVESSENRGTKFRVELPLLPRQSPKKKGEPQIIT